MKSFEISYNKEEGIRGESMGRMKIIVNPQSGREFGLEVVKNLIPLTCADGWEVILNFTQKRGDGIEFAKEDDCEDLIVCIGGDGTVNEVVNGIYQAKRQVPLAIIPAGTVNDFGKFLNLPRNAKDFYAMIKRAKICPIDIGVCGERAFINVCAGGLFTEIAYSVPESSKSIMGRLAYYLEAVKEVALNLHSKDSFALKIKSGNTIIQTKAMLFLVANSTSIGGMQNLAPEADIHDGLLDVLIFEEMQISEIIELLADIRFGRHSKNPHVMYFKTEEIFIQSDRDLPLDLDGELAGSLPKTIRIEKNAIKLYLN